jgi:hypothetical protein
MRASAVNVSLKLFSKKKKSLSNSPILHPDF